MESQVNQTETKTEPTNNPMTTQTETQCKATRKSRRQTPADAANTAQAAAEQSQAAGKSFLDMLNAGSPELRAELEAELAEMLPENAEPETLKPHFECSGKGVFFVGVDTKAETPSYTQPERLSDEIRLIGRGIDQSGSHYRVLQWRDRLTHSEKTDAMPMSIIGSNECWSWLRSRGITVLQRRAKQERLIEYLQDEGSNAPWTVTNKAGWLNDAAYILPNGEVIQPARAGRHQPQKAVYSGDKSDAKSYTLSGSLNDWQAQIGRYARGNSRLMLCIGSALAAPFMRILDIEGGGFHLYGDSSDGKTTIAKAALSVWGKADDLKLGWNGTGLGFANVAYARNDGLLVLDEIGEAAPKTVSTTAYSVLNGRGKIQGAKDGGNRAVNEWRILLLSTGEKTIEGYLKHSNADLHAGQAARLPSIPANAGKGAGVFETLHGQADGAKLAEHLNDAANRFYGTAGRALIEAILNDVDARANARDELNAFIAALPAMSGQAHRVAKRFALVAAALIQAAKYGVLPLERADIYAGIKKCFDAWAQLEGMGKREDRQIADNGTSWFQVHSGGDRFVVIGTDAHPHQAGNHAGYIKRKDSPEHDEYWIIPDVFDCEIAKSFDRNKACTVLHSIGWLKKPNDNRWTFQLRDKMLGNKGRYIVFVGAQPPSENDSNDSEE